MTMMISEPYHRHITASQNKPEPAGSSQYKPEHAETSQNTPSQTKASQNTPNHSKEAQIHTKPSPELIYGPRGCFLKPATH